MLSVIYHALVGFHLGFVFALLCAQWTWLELRVNTGMLILLGCFIGAISGLFRDAKRPLVIGSLSVIAVVFASLVITQGEWEAMRILLGVIFREGTLMPDLSLPTADLMAMGLGVLTILVASVYYRACCTPCQRSRHEKD